MGNLLRNRSRRAVFLCYHSVAASGPRYLTVSAELFERQLALLRRRGFRTGALPELDAAATGSALAPTAFLTFDDGFLDNHQTVLPLLREHGQRAFCFVLPPLVDEGGALDWPEMSQDLRHFATTMRSVTWPMVEEMAEGGFTIGSHGLTHPNLTELGPERLRQELLDSRRQIEERLGSCETLAYPFGDWSREVEAAAADCGYRFAFTLPNRVGQRQATPLSIPRINVDYRDDEARFGAKLSPAGRRFYLSTAVGGVRSRARTLVSRGG